MDLSVLSDGILKRPKKLERVGPRICCVHLVRLCLLQMKSSLEEVKTASSPLVSIEFGSNTSCTTFWDSFYMFLKLQGFSILPKALSFFARPFPKGRNAMNKLYDDYIVWSQVFVDEVKEVRLESFKIRISIDETKAK